MKKRQKGLPLYPGYLRTYSLLTILIIIETVAVIAQAFFLARAITFLFQKMPIQDVFIDIGFFFLAFIIRYIISQAEIAVAEKYSKDVGTYLREKLLYRYFHQPSHYVQRVGTGHLVQLMMEGIDDVKKYVEIIGIRMIRTVITPAAIVVYIYFYDPISSVILVATVPIVVIFMILLGLAAEKMADNQYVLYTRLANHFVDSLKGLETLAFLGRSKEHGRRIKQVSDDYRKATMKTLRVAFLSSFALDFFTSLSIAFVAVGLGLRLIDGVIVLLPALTILILAPEYFSPIKQVGKDYHATLDGQVAMTHINEWLEEDMTAENSEASLLQENVHSIAMENIQFELDEKYLVEDLSFQVSKGMIGIVGRSGAGKTTLINILAGRMAPTQGRIRINEEVYDSLHVDEWFEHIAYIPQHPYIFPLSLADNIRFYQPDATDIQVEEMVRKIGLQSVVAKFPHGIHEKIGEGGRTLSGGQEQRIALARALLSDKSVILLDEPTAHLDIETEYEIKQLILELMSDKFVFIATHRLHWMANVDQIVMVDDGKVVANDTHDLLMKENEAYRKFYDYQRGGQTRG
ncbi:MAG TPA: thiol reductant ABC exporter subunit CydD [Pseudogracilibacillus sp.]|nr:thiol reductant ABC exporter subunit CydD [Pseudogracilibacillus sp.]